MSARKRPSWAEPRVICRTLCIPEPRPPLFLVRMIAWFNMLRRKYGFAPCTSPEEAAYEIVHDRIRQLGSPEPDALEVGFYERKRRAKFPCEKKQFQITPYSTDPGRAQRPVLGRRYDRWPRVVGARNRFRWFLRGLRWWQH